MRFARALQHVLKLEGGYVNDPRDPGGATNRGITQRTYDAWRRERGLPPRDVRQIEEREVAEIYFERYWKACRCEELPPPLDVLVFDAAVNQGPAVAVRLLQRALGVAVDGVVGPQTIRAAQTADLDEIVPLYLAERALHYVRLAHFDRFGRGWLKRLFWIARHA